MTSLLPALSQPLPIQAADTVITVAARSGIEVAADVSLVFMAGATGILALVLAIFLLRVRRLERNVRSLLTRVEHGVEPVLDRGRSVAENVDFITRAIRTDVEKLNESVERLNRRLKQASDRMEERIEEFNALMKVVQGEAEELFIDTASTVRGVRAGTRSLGGDGESGDEKEG